MTIEQEYWAFMGPRIVAQGTLLQVAQQLRTAQVDVRSTQLALFERATGRLVDFNLQGTAADLAARFSNDKGQKASESGTDTQRAAPGAESAPKTRGRPKLGVIGREVTLLPRHWQWLEQQRGGASAALRRLVDHARKTYAHQDEVRQAQDRGNRFMGAIAGDLAGFEDAVRALYAQDQKAFAKFTQQWPSDIRQALNQLVADAFATHTQP